jgi:hypothetical protein
MARTWKHAQVEQEQVEMLGVEHGDGLRAVVHGLDVGLAGQAREDFLVDLQDVLFVVEDEDSLADGHGQESSGGVGETRRWWRRGVGNIIGAGL